jgi:hypothetical protein
LRTASKAYQELPFQKRAGTITAKAEAQIETWYCTTFKHISLVEEELLTFEDEHAIPQRWLVALGNLSNLSSAYSII